MRRLVVAPRQDRLDRLVAEAAGTTRRAARRAVRAGDVRVDGRVVRSPGLLVPAGALVEWRRVEEAGPPRPEVVHRDRWLLAVVKPAGLPSQPTRRGGPDLLALLADEEPRLWLHHRLDTPASGLLLLARHPDANAPLARAFRERRARRRYLAAVVGDPGEAGRWTTPVRGRPAESRWRRLAAGEGMSVLEVELVTGRTHQVRVHAADAGHPVVGDRRHGGAAGRAGARLALHAWALDLEHPVTGEPLALRAPPGDDLRPLLERAGYRSSM